MAVTRTFSIIKPDATRRNLTGAIDQRSDAISSALERGLGNVERTLNPSTAKIADSLRHAIAEATTAMSLEARQAREGLEGETAKIAESVSGRKLRPSISWPSRKSGVPISRLISVATLSG